MHTLIQTLLTDPSTRDGSTLTAQSSQMAEEFLPWGP